MKLTSLLAIIFSFSLYSCTNDSVSRAKNQTLPDSMNPPIRVDNIKDITVLAHLVCGFWLTRESDINNYVFAEGDVCPIGGGDCSYSALMNIDGEDIRLKKDDLDEEDNISIFRFMDVEVRVNYSFNGNGCSQQDESCESVVAGAEINVIRGKSTTKINVKGECGA